MGLLEVILGKQNPVAQWAAENSGTLGALGAGIGSGTNLGQGLSNAAQNIPQGKLYDQKAAAQRKADALAETQLNATKTWLQKNRPDLTPMLDMGMSPAQVWEYAHQPQAAGKKPIEINGQLIDPDTFEVLGDFRTPETPKEPAAPSGYRFGAMGNLEFIPGGPADPSTAGKTTEATRRNQQLATVIVPELKSLMGDGATPGTFDALANGWDQAKGMIPGGNTIGLTATSPQYQQAQDSLKTIVASYLYSVSGATANPGEVANQVDVLTPKPGDSPERVAAKKDRIMQMVKAVEAAATGTPISIDGGTGGDADIEGILSGLGI